jgi:hypothetical protein
MRRLTKINQERYKENMSTKTKGITSQQSKTVNEFLRMHSEHDKLEKALKEIKPKIITILKETGGEVTVASGDRLNYVTTQRTTGLPAKDVQDTLTQLQPEILPNILVVDQKSAKALVETGIITQEQFDKIVSVSESVSVRVTKSK